MSTEESKEGYSGWSILELMGHRRLGGYITETTLAGKGMLRIDIPGKDGARSATQLYSLESVYCLTPSGEAEARAVALRSIVEPVARWEMPRLAHHEETAPRVATDYCPCQHLVAHHNAEGCQEGVFSRIDCACLEHGLELYTEEED